MLRPAFKLQALQLRTLHVHVYKGSPLFSHLNPIPVFHLNSNIHTVQSIFTFSQIFRSIVSDWMTFLRKPFATVIARPAGTMYPKNEMSRAIGHRSRTVSLSTTTFFRCPRIVHPGEWTKWVHLRSIKKNHKQRSTWRSYFIEGDNKSTAKNWNRIWTNELI